MWPHAQWDPPGDTGCAPSLERPPMPCPLLLLSTQGSPGERGPQGTPGVRGPRGDPVSLGTLWGGQTEAKSGSGCQNHRTHSTKTLWPLDSRRHTPLPSVFPKESPPPPAQEEPSPQGVQGAQASRAERPPRPLMTLRGPAREASSCVNVSPCGTVVAVPITRFTGLLQLLALHLVRQRGGHAFSCGTFRVTSLAGPQPSPQHLRAGWEAVAAQTSWLRGWRPGGRAGPVVQWGGFAGPAGRAPGRLCAWFGGTGPPTTTPELGERTFISQRQVWARPPAHHSPRRVIRAGATGL